MRNAQLELGCFKKLIAASYNLRYDFNIDSELLKGFSFNLMLL